MKIAIISAMIEEIQPILDNYDLAAIDELNGNDIFYTKDKNELYLFNTGIGKVNAVLTTAIFLYKYNVDLVISIGTGGSFSKETQIGDLIIGTELAYNDVDVTHFGYEYGQVPQSNLFYKTKRFPILEVKLQEIFSNVHYGLITTGDRFVDSSFLPTVQHNFPNCLAVEMESTAIVQTCQTLDVNIAVYRTISDIITLPNNKDQFTRYLNLTSQRFLNLFTYLLKEYDEKC